jgi:DNA-binding phage protein
MPLKHLIRRLQRTPHPIAAIAREAGTSRHAVLSIRDEQTGNPGIMTVDAITEALNRLDKQKKETRK